MTGSCRGTVLPGATVGRAQLLRPRTSPPGTTVTEAAAFFRDDHVHALLVVQGDRLLAVVERADLRGALGGRPARLQGRLAGRTVSPGADLDATREHMLRQGSRRLAVVDQAGSLLGLLCLQRTGRGFCSEADVAARAAERLLLDRSGRESSSRCDDTDT